MSKPAIIANYGLGVDSTAVLLRWIFEPETRPCPLGDLIVITAMTGNEWPRTGSLVQAHMIPLFRRHGIRFVQVARHGRLKADGITVLGDSRGYEPLRLEGDYKLSQEMVSSGTVPQVGGLRKCSIHAKGEVIDKWLRDELQGRPFLQMIGYEDSEKERGRAKRDKEYNTGDQAENGHPAGRTGWYPLIEWGWNRAKCEEYIFEKTGARWIKSACTFCPFALSGCEGQERVKPMFAAEPEAGLGALTMEYLSVALNPLQGLIKSVELKSGMRWGRLSSLLAGTGEHDAVMQRFQEELASCEWRVYEVQRVAMPTEKDPEKGTWNRSVRSIAFGSRAEMLRDLAELAWSEGARTETDQDGIHRVYLERRGDGFPCYERMYVAAPAGCEDKEEQKFRTAMAQYAAWAESAA